MLPSPVALFDTIDDHKLKDLLVLSAYERRHSVKALKLYIPEQTLEDWEARAREPIAEIREWAVEGGPYVEIQVGFDNGSIKTLREIVAESNAKHRLFGYK
ncbi:MAG: hypothetical protein QM758_05925 [Armatimonas sp.]